MYKSNIIKQKCVYLMITLGKQKAFVGKSDMIYDCPRETVPEQFFGLIFLNYNYKAVEHFLESVYKKAPISTPFLAEQGQTNLLFCVCDGGTLLSLEKMVK